MESDLSNENENHLESENLDDSVVEGYEAGHEEEEGEREGAGIGLEFYSNNELLDFAATALLQGKIHEHKSKHSQSGYIADSEFTDTNVPVLHSPNTETEEGKQSQLNNQNNNISTVHSSKKSNESSTRISYRSEGLAPVPDPFYAHELSNEKMVAVVNDFDENRSEGSLADESQFESMKPKVTLPNQDDPINDNGQHHQENQHKDNESDYSSSDEINPPIPIFKTIEEEEPEIVLQKLKETEKI